MHGIYYALLRRIEIYVHKYYMQVQSAIMQVPEMKMQVTGCDNEGPGSYFQARIHVGRTRNTFRENESNGTMQC